MKNFFFTALVAVASTTLNAALPVVTVPDFQPLAAQIRRVIDAADSLGSPISPADKAALESALAESNGALAATKVQAILDPHCLFGVNINPEMRVKVAVGDARPELDETGWRVFLVKVQNEAGTTAELKAESANAKRVAGSAREEIANRWLDLTMFNAQPLRKEMGGLPLEYRLIQLYSRDAGKREAKFSFNVGQGTQDLGFRNEVDVLFTCRPAHEVKLQVQDENGQPTTAAFLIRDGQGRVYPAQSKRLAPDFAFHPQVYRADGESVRLPNGRYSVEFSRGPESIPQKREFAVIDGTGPLRFQVQRWIDPSKFGWISGDHHIHAAGCAHYQKPTEGVLATDMMRHVLGEDLKVGCNLTWGPCFDYQKQFFTGKDDKVSAWPYVLRYDVEVSGFGSHESGHLCLLRLKEEIYPGGDSKDHWPKLCLNTLKWGKRQGALVGPAHSGWGLQADSTELPNFTVPPFNGIGANEYIVDVTHMVPGPDGKPVPAVDFLSMVDTPYPWELNIWYHTLNAGFRTRVSGETDFPCIYGERVGLGRSYVKLPAKWTYEDWCEGIRAGRNYVSDGFSHLMDMKVNGVAMGEQGSEVRLTKAATVKVTARVAARLDEKANPEIKQRKVDQHPFWNVERARIDGTREVPVELIVNGVPVAKKNLVADGHIENITFEAPIERSSWVAVRILPSAHTNPVFVLVGDKPVRASRRSVQWCLDSVEKCWKEKERFLKGAEHEEGVAAYDHARETYRRLLAECEVD